MSQPRSLSVKRDSGRVLQVLADDGHEGLPMVFHWGTPCAALWYEPLVRASQHAGLRLITYSRPGYDGSDPQPGRRVADVAADVATILDAVGVDEFVSLGWSGGGPHSIACAALLPKRCLAAGAIAGIAPYPADGIDWLAGMATENVEEFSAAIAGEATLRPLLDRLAPPHRAVTGADVATTLGSLVSDVDRQALTGEFADMLAASFHAALEPGIEGWLEDDLAFGMDWGFSLSEIRIPVAIWHGEHDSFVPFAHGQWLARQIPGVRSHLSSDHGHISLVSGMLDEIVRELAATPAASSART